MPVSEKRSAADPGHWSGTANELKRGFLRGQPECAAVIGLWVRAASTPFRLRLRGDWEDLLQEVQLELLGKLEGADYPAVGALRRHVAQVTVHRCIDRVRRAQRWRFEELPELSERVERPTRPIDAFLRIRRIVDGLPENCLKLWRDLAAGFSYAEMAQRHGVREGTLRVRVLRCRQAANDRRQELEDQPTVGGVEDPPVAGQGVM